MIITIHNVIHSLERIITLHTRDLLSLYFVLLGTRITSKASSQCICVKRRQKVYRLHSFILKDCFIHILPLRDQSIGDGKVSK